MAEPAMAEAEDVDEDVDVDDDSSDDIEEDADELQPPEDSSDDGLEGEKIIQTDAATTGIDPDGLFDGVEMDSESGGDSVADKMFDGIEGDDGSSGDSGESVEGATTRSRGLASDINAGCARLAVVGLDDKWTTESGEEKKKTDLESEFRDVFEAFRLGHYASITLEEYILVDQEDIHPVWGLVGAMLICAAVIVYKRPDGDQVVESAKLKVGQFDLSDIRKQ